jgi:hypothetical protein
MNRLADTPRPEEPKNYCYQVQVAVILVRAGESKEKAWQRYLRDHPEYCYGRNNVRIFHLDHREFPEDLAHYHPEPMAGRREDGDQRNLAGGCGSAN